ncbi:MAG: hypothetical protein WCD69_16890, partial [Xanthobacteraceae bacterium]
MQTSINFETAAMLPIKRLRWVLIFRQALLVALNLNFEVEVQFEDTSLKIALAERFLRSIKWSDQNRPLSKAAYKDTEHPPRVLRVHFVDRGPQRNSGSIGGNDGAAICQNDKLFLQRGDENGDSYGPR